MTEIRFETGVKAYTLNDCCEIYFNPTDSFFVEKLFEVFDNLDRKQEEYRSEVERTADHREVFKIARKRDAEMREALDGVLGLGVCKAVFGDVNVYALAQGVPLWANLLLAIVEELDTAFAREQKVVNPRVSKYTKKYHK
jgi:hypothetical protein